MSGREFSERDIHLALDGELPTDEAASFERWLDANPEMKARNARFAEDRRRLQEAFAGVMQEPVPDRLAKLVAGEAEHPSRAPRWRAAAAAAVLFLAGGLGGYLLGTGRLGMTAEAGDEMAEAAVAAHVIYAAEQRHAVEVGADDRPHLVNWLSRRIGLTLVTPDLTSDGFTLVGGRLLPGKTGPAALLLYEDGTGNRVSVYVTSEAAGKARGAYSEAGRPTAIYWVDQGYGCAIVGALPTERLQQVARHAYRQLLAGAGRA